MTLRIFEADPPFISEKKSAKSLFNLNLIGKVLIKAILVFVSYLFVNYFLYLVVAFCLVDRIF